MIYPIVAYGHPVLRKKCENIPLSQDVHTIISNMYETMYHAKGVGLAAPQIGLSHRIFIVDSTQINDEEKPKDRKEPSVKQAFINAEIVELYGDMTSYEEGCLSIPNIYANVERPNSVRIRYYDEDFNLQEKEFSGFVARIIQHEYDHIEGVLFIDKIKPLKKTMIKRKLEDIKKGAIHPRYKMKFANG